ncbi:hypothetical protein [Serratia liquefaciens]|uniref:hypothetical protein n=1 Tax=Serratia liquefaciens TaxID=614 RepID=UPI0039057AAD
MTQTLTTDRLREITEDGFLEHGDAKSMAAELLANREAQPVAWTTPEELSEADCGDVWMWLAPRKYPGEIALYTVPPAPACSKCGGRGTYHDVGACGTVECECTLSSVPPVPVELIDQVCNAAAGIYRQSDDDKAQAIIDSIRVMLAAPKGGK